MKKTLAIIGAGGQGKVIADIGKLSGRWENIVFLDDDPSITSAMGFEVVGKTADAPKYKQDADFFVAIGSRNTREKVLDNLIDQGYSIASPVHPDAVLGSKVEIGKGTVVMAGVVINCLAKIGRGCIINTGCTIDHDCDISDFVHISPGVNLGGTVSVGKGTWIGIGSSVTNNVSIAGECIIGAGTVVIKDLDTSGTYVGVPARKIK